MSDRDDLPPWAREDPRHQFRRRVAYYGVAVLREEGDDLVAARLLRMVGFDAATAWRRACAVETPTPVMEWSS